VHVKSGVRYERGFTFREGNGCFDFSEQLEQVPDWQDWLIVDLGPVPERFRPTAWAAWNSTADGSHDRFKPITEGLPPGQRDR
jgi:hypothetical protein